MSYGLKSKNRSLEENEIRTVTLIYSPHQPNKSESALKMRIKKQPYPFYYTLFTPNEFNFENTKYGFIQDNKIIYSQT